MSRRGFLRNVTVVAGSLAAGFGFLRPTEGGGGVLRPPGALAEDEFLARCIRCGQCGDACPNQAIRPFTREAGRPFSLAPGRAEVGTPVIFPRLQACNLCGGDQGKMLLCTAACPTGALVPVEKNAAAIQEKVSMGVSTLDENLCYSYQGSSCGVCVKACPFEGKALRAGFMEQPILDPAYCVGCGLCERACIRYPQAISIVPNRRRGG
ncbi:MAG: 4Fe-4S dicluster domain-containing protein [Deltaproteobacteria bacterium]|nr:MAG: 4Fe-4S dicluster domain-containing protein [Deltaproteobacteria bacterium]